MKKLIVAVATVLALTGCGKDPAVPCETPQRPHCPTEDSCPADYRDGQWWIGGVQVTQ